MDPNSLNQRWSKWRFHVLSGGACRPAFADVKQAASVFGRLHFGSVAAMQIREFREGGKPVYVIEVRTEGKPVHDPQFVPWMHAQWVRWGERGFGPGTEVALLEAKLEAGDRQDGSPRDQLIIMDAELARIPLC